MKEYEDEKEVFLKKLTSQIGTIGNILQKESCGLITEDVRKALKKNLSEAERLKKKLENNEFEISIVGVEKAGKSTFANALMGSNILPTDTKRCTYTSTKMCYGNDTAIVKFFSKEEFHSSFVSKLQEMGIENASSYNYDSLSLSSYTSMFENLDVINQKAYRATTNKDVEESLKYKETIRQYLGRPDMTFSGAELETTEFNKFIRNAQFALAVKEISLMSSKIQAKNAVIYDVPGFNSPTKIHKEQTVEFMKRADAIILVVNSYEPSFTDSSVDMFNNVVDEDGNDIGSKIFVFANKADRDVQNLPKNLDVLKRELAQYRVMPQSNFDSRIVPGSAFLYLVKNVGVETSNTIDKSIDDGIDKIWKLLVEYNKSERFEILKKRVNRNLNNVLEIFKTLSEDYSDDGKDIFWSSNTSAISSALRRKNKDIEKELKDYRRNILYEYDEDKEHNKKRPISEVIKSQIINEINLENYSVTDEDYDDAEKENDDSSRHDTPEKTEDFIREKKKNIIYNNFIEGVVGLAYEIHEKCDEKMVAIFLNAFDVNKSHPYYDVVRTNISSFINNHKVSLDSKGYYKSLIERFAKSLFEAIINTRSGSLDRWHKFHSEESDFLSLSTYDVNRNEEASLREQPLNYIILYQTTQKLGTYENREQIMGLIEKMKTVLDFVPTGPIPKLLSKAVLNPRAYKLVQDYMPKIKNFSENQVAKQLSSYLTQCNVKEEDIDELSLVSYQKYWGENRNKDRETIIKDIELDISNLHDVLNNIVIDAIYIEKAFRAFVVGNINNIISSLSSKEFDDFIDNNVGVIRAREYSDVEQEMQMRIARKNILNDIKVQLNSLDSPKGQEEVSKS